MAYDPFPLPFASPLSASPFRFRKSVAEEVYSEHPRRKKDDRYTIRALGGMDHSQFVGNKSEPKHDEGESTHYHSFPVRAARLQGASELLNCVARHRLQDWYAGVGAFFLRRNLCGVSERQDDSRRGAEPRRRGGGKDNGRVLSRAWATACEDPVHPVAEFVSAALRLCVSHESASPI